NRPLAGTIPPQFLQEQKTTLDELKRLIGDWDGMQAGATLERIEAQVIEIRNLVSNGVQLASPPAAAAPTAAPAVRERPASTPAPATAPAAGATTNSSWWEKQKAAMLGESPPAETPAPAPVASVASVAVQSPEESAESKPAPIQLSDAVIPDPPEPVDFEN